MEETFSEYIENKRKDLVQATKDIKKLDTLLKGFAQKQDLKKIKQAALTLKQPQNFKFDMQAFSLGIAQEFEQYAKEQEQSRERVFLLKLKELAQEKHLGFKRVTQDPPEFRLGAFSLFPDYKSGVVTLSYARLPIEEVEISADVVMKAYIENHQILNRQNFEPTEFFSKLLMAYRRALQGNSFGSRCPLTDIYPELNFLLQSAKFMQNPIGANFVPYKKVQMAWDIARMRASIGMEHKGIRLNLGVATINTTKNKNNVLFLEEGGGQGQYYISLWFTK